MLNTVVSIGNAIASRAIVGVLNLSSDHPIVLCFILAGLMGAIIAALLDMIGTRFGVSRTTPEPHDRPIQLRRTR